MRASIKFKIRSSKVKTSMLYLTISYQYTKDGKFQQLKIATGNNISTKHFDSKTGIKSSVGNIPLKLKVNKFKNEIEEKLNQLSLKRNISRIPPQSLLSLLLDKDQELLYSTLPEYIDFYIKNLSGKKSISTIKGYKYLKKRLIGSGFDFNIENINTDYVISYFESIKSKFNPNSMWKEKKNLRKYCKLLKIEVDWSNEKLQFKEVQTKAIYLNLDQLVQLWTFEFESKCLERVRDGFMFQCFTGMRFSDFIINQAEFIKDGTEEFVYYKSIKTGVESYIPVVPILKQLLNKYNYNLPVDISNANYNAYLKEAGKKVFEKEPKVNRDGVLVDFSSMICSHTARRSFATNFYKAKIPVLYIMNMLGMTKEKTFYNYIRVEKLEKAKEVYKQIMDNKEFSSFFSQTQAGQLSHSV